MVERKIVRDLKQDRQKLSIPNLIVFGVNMLIFT